MNNNKKALEVTIVIPAYNEEKRIRRCLDLIKVQTVVPKVIVVDNNSSDDTSKIAGSYEFVSVVKENKQGIVFARNAGFNKATTEIIGRIDADSILPKNWVERIVNFYSHESNINSAVTGSGYPLNTIFPPKKLLSFLHEVVVFRYNKLILGHYILWGSNMALLKSQWEEVKHDVYLDTDIHEDIDLAIHLREKGVKIRYLKSIKVGAELRRVIHDLPSIYDNLMLWPRTFRRHGNKRWILGLIGVYFLLIVAVLVHFIHLPFRIAGRI